MLWIYVASMLVVQADLNFRSTLHNFNYGAKTPILGRKHAFQA